MKRNYEKEIKIFKEMLIKGVSNDIILQTLTLFENYNENEEVIETKKEIEDTDIIIPEEENKVEEKIGSIRKEIEIENVLAVHADKKIKEVIDIKPRTRMNLDDITNNFKIFIEYANIHKSLISSNESKNKTFFIMSENTDECKIVFPVINKETMINLNKLLKFCMDKNLSRKSMKNRRELSCFIKRTRNGFKIIFNKEGDKEGEFLINSSIYKRYRVLSYNLFIIKGLDSDIIDMINKSFMICNNFEIRPEELTINFSFNTKVNQMNYSSTFRIVYTNSAAKRCHPYKLIIANSGITSKLKIMNTDRCGIFYDFNSRFDEKRYNVYANRNILVVVPKNKNIKNEFIKNFMLNNDIYKINIQYHKKGKTLERYILLDQMCSDFTSKFKQFGSLLEDNVNTLQYLSFEVKTTHILEEDSWIFDFNNLNVDSLIL